MSKRTRQYIGILAAVIAYYLVHEGAHLLYALFTGVFRQVNFMGLGVQVDVFRERMTDTQLGIFCLVGALATFCIAYLLTALAKKICTARIKLLRAVLYYITIALLLIDPLSLSILCGLFGGGDMNGIAFLLPEWAARIGFGALLIVNGLVFWKLVLPVYSRSFSKESIKMKYKSFILLFAAVMVLSLTACGKSPAPGKSELSPSNGTQVEASNEGNTPANESSAEDADTSANDEAWKKEFEKSLLENYGVTPDHYEDLGDGIYQVYVEINSEVVPYVTVDSATGDYHG